MSQGTKPRRVGLFLVSRITGYQHFLAKECTAAAARHGIAVDVFSADDTGPRQSGEALKFVHDHPGDELAVITMPVNDVGHEKAVEGLARKVLARGAAWIVLNRDLEGLVVNLRAAYPAAIASLVTIDNSEVGRIQATQVSAVVPQGDALMLYVVGNAFTSAARDRKAAFLERMTPRGARIHQVEGLWSTESAQRVIGKWLASLGPKEALAAIACQNDPMAVGARNELTRLAKEMSRPEWLRVPVFGVDGVPDEGKRLVDEGRITATVVVPATSAAAVELLVRAWNGTAQAPAKLLLPVKPYSKF
jgi:ABC-type sugar transport system substrate-binding protein